MNKSQNLKPEKEKYLQLDLRKKIMEVTVLPSRVTFGLVFLVCDTENYALRTLSITQRSRARIIFLS